MGFPSSIYSAATPAANSVRSSPDSPATLYTGLYNEVVAIETFLGVGGDNVGGLISAQVLSGTSPTITFSGIPATFTHLRLRALLNSDNVANTDTISITVNGVQGSAVYDEIVNVGVNAPYYNAGEVSWGYPYFVIPALTGTSGIAATLNIDIPFYTNTTWQKMVAISGGFFDALTSSTDGNWYSSFGVFRQTNAITSITLTATNGPFAMGCAAYLYGAQ
jgi:hypothetical protein